MLRLVFAVVLLAIPSTSLASPFVPTKQGFLWKQGEQWVRFDKGRWSAGIDGGGSVQWSMFFWHDRWVYEALPSGTVTSGPSLAADGTLTMDGTFPARERSAPVRYAYRLTPSADGIDVRCELQKTAELKLCSGVWLHVRGDRKSLRGSERLWLEPSAGGTVATHVHGQAKWFHMELRNGVALQLGGIGLHEISTESAKDFLYRFNLLPDDFEVGKKVAIEYRIRFGNLPAKLPGDIQANREPLALRAVQASAAQVPQYGKLELNVDLAASYKNPFDPDEIRLDAEFASPSGKTIVVPGFFMVDFRREVHPKSELLFAEGNGRWKVRFTPRETGRYTWRLMLRDRSGKIAGGEGAFEATAPQTAGFIRRSAADPHYLAFDNGTGYFPVGHNLPIYHPSGQLGDEAMRRFAAAKETFNRWWMSADGFGLEWMDRLGWYRQDAAARLDLVVDLARELGLYYMMCMDTHQDFREKGWDRNPFNAVNGGPCAKPADWFTDPTARDYYKKRLRYTVARWGYSPNILCWEFGNEIEGWYNSPDTVKLPWTKEMADHLRAIDPFGHLITTSFWTNVGPEEYWKLDNIDIVQTHLYTGNDAGVAEQVRDCCLHQWKRFDKPHIFGEFGIRAGEGTPEKDPQGWAIHNSLWAGLVSLAAGGPMPWWHENYLDKLDLYFHFTALANFTAGVPLGSVRWMAASIDPPEYADRNRKPELRDIVLAPHGSGWVRPEVNEFVLGRDGIVADGRGPASLLHGSGHRDLRSPPTFVVHYPQPGKFVVRVGRVSHSGQLKIWIDDRPVLDRELPCAEGLGKSGVYRPQWKLWETTYDEDLAVDVPAGDHRIRVDNAGKDWMSIGRYVFTGCRVVDRPDANLWGIAADDLALVWLQNRESTWFNHAGGGVVRPIDAFRFRVSGIPNGHYRLQWWETWKGRIEREEQADVTDGSLTIQVPALRTDAAIKIRRAQ